MNKYSKQKLNERTKKYSQTNEPDQHNILFIVLFI